MPFPVGTVLKYKNYPFGEDGIQKNYWFIVLGRSSQFDSPILCYLSKTTTQSKYYEVGGKRSTNVHKLLTKKQYSFFEQDCYIDFDLPIISRHSLEEIDKLVVNNTIEEMGRLDKNLQELYNLAVKGSGLSKKEKDDIHNSFNMDGIEGLKLPKSRDKAYYKNKYQKK